MIRKIEISDLLQLNEMTNNFDFIVKEENLLNNIEKYVGYFISDKLVAFICYSVYFERAEINYIYVKDEYRRFGIASKLMKYMIQKCNNLENVTLEVRESNCSAINLYKKFGFSECTIRKNYYGSEDAILMIKKFGDNNE